MKFIAIFLVMFSFLTFGEDSQKKQFSATEASEAGCLIRLAKDFLASAKWNSALELEDKVYFHRNLAPELGSLTSPSFIKPNRYEPPIYTIYAKGNKELENAPFKLTFYASWTSPTCTARDFSSFQLFDQNNRNIRLQGESNDETVSVYRKEIYSSAHKPNAAFLAAREYDVPPPVEKVADPAVLKKDISLGLGTTLVGSAGLAIPVKPASSVSRKVLKRVVAPALIFDGAMRIHEANQGHETGTLAISGPVKRYYAPPVVQGVLRLPESYEKQLDEGDEKKK